MSDYARFGEKEEVRCCKPLWYIPRRLLLVLDSIFFATGGIFVTKGAAELAVPIALGTPPIGDPNDHTWKYVAFAAGAVLFLAQLIPITRMVGKEINRIQNVESTYWFHFTDLKATGILFCTISVFVVIQKLTSQVYASRLFYMATQCVGPLIGYPSFPLMYHAIFWKPIRSEDEEGHALSVEADAAQP